MIGLDTGFFFVFKAGHRRAVALYERITEQEQEAAVSTITVFEVLRHGYVGRLDRTFAEQAARSVGVAFQRAGTDQTDVLRRGARITHGMGLPMADAMIAASLESVGCDRLVTTDSDFEHYEGEMDVVFL